MKLSKHGVLLGALLGCIGLLLAFAIHTADGRVGRAGNLSSVDPDHVKFFKEDFTYFQVKSKPGPHDWLARHKESGQSYAQYLRDGSNIPSANKNILYVMPIGKFDENSPSLEVLEEYMKAYFTPMKVTMMQPVEDAKVKAKSRLNAGKKQWKSTDILDWMKPQLPKDAYAMIAVSMTDLYPDEKWNFVFGQASLKGRVGVFSFARYTDDDPSVSLLRAMKVLTHEMGHMFGIKHCIFYQCNMNGANHLQEVDSTPPHLCPVCLRKVYHAIGFDPKKRYQELSDFYQKHELKKEHEWVEKRLK